MRPFVPEKVKIKQEKTKHESEPPIGVIKLISKPKKSAPAPPASAEPAKPKLTLKLKLPGPSAPS